MKQQVNDITEVLAGLSSQLESMRKTIEEQHATICQISRTCQHQLKEIRDLKKEIKGNDRTIEDFRGRLSKYEEPPLDSGNSNTPPSKESMKSGIVRRTKA